MFYRFNVVLCHVILIAVAWATVGCHEAERASHAAAAAPLSLMAAIPLGDVRGRLDHLCYDPHTQRLFVSALENHTVEVVDIRSQKHVHTIVGLSEPQGLACVPAAGRLLVCGRGDGTCRSFDLNSFEEGPWVDLGRNADNVRYDGRGTIYVGSGGEPGAGLMSAIELASLLPASMGGKPAAPHSPADLRLEAPRQGEVKAEVEFPSHPESFQLAADGQRIFVNLPDEHQVAVVDVTDKGLRMSARWPVAAAKNFPMALDAETGRVFIACRQPACVAVYDCQTGKGVSSTPCVGDADDMSYDPAGHLLYVIGGEGFLDVFKAAPGATSLVRLAHVATAPKARTGMLIPGEKLLAVVAPGVGNEQARVLLYRVGE